MIGTGWLVLMDDWLGRGGPLGAILGFVLGGIILLPVGYVYGQWVLRLPDAAGEAAYTAQVFPPIVSYFTGWIMLLAYFIVCPWEAIALGKIAAYIFPQLDSIEVYRVAGQPVFLLRLVLGIALTIFLTMINYRGIRLSANFQKGMTTIVLLIFLALVAISAVRGSPANLHPVFHATPLVSILLTLQIVPYFLTGFESVPKYAEEANPDFRGKTYMTAIAMALGVGVSFYAFSLAAVSYIAPWQSLLGQAFRHGHCLRARPRQALARPTHPRHGHVRPLPMLQRQLRRRHSDDLRLRSQRLGPGAASPHPSAFSNSQQRDPHHRRGHARGSLPRRCHPRPRNRSWFRSRSLWLASLLRLLAPRTSPGRQPQSQH